MATVSLVMDMMRVERVEEEKGRQAKGGRQRGEKGDRASAHSRARGVPYRGPQGSAVGSKGERRERGQGAGIERQAWAWIHSNKGRDKERRKEGKEGRHKGR